ncbi:MAG: phosphoribosylaminoimidazolecarboxamide formyltransferase/IMP cyclohydrolase [Flavobacteriales bacterium]|jgi:phosphoribosylaminoimidazolecarboxamide formyltransferase/IMP cyclohydrolase|tara:strand:+ start:11574 stop:13094 length:1521 start_codon:yes stop_codon:yes gene_type:complete
MADVKIKSALISVFDKGNLEPVVRELNDLGVTIYSTGGTQSFIEGLGIAVERVEDLTDYPSILGGRVKTLHPKIFGGILGRRGLDSDVSQMSQYSIPEIDLVIVDLYPFEDTVASGADHADIIEKIDIGGISLIRAAAKNYKDVVIVPSKNQYQPLLDIISSKEGVTSTEDRKQFALSAFNVSSHYDSQIFKYFDGEDQTALKVSETTSQTLRYGENPHQKGAFFGDLNQIFDKLHGKELSYNNLLDVDAAVNLMSEFSETTFAVLKHNNACGVATRPTVLEAWKAALGGDPISAFGGVLITNVKVDRATAVEIQKLFFEVLIAPEYDADALEVLTTKKNRIILIQKEVVLPQTTVRSALNGVLVQGKDSVMETEADLKPATNKLPTAAENKDLIFAAKICKHTKSNTIVFAKDNTLISSGTGQTSRVDALRQAVKKADAFEFSLKGAVMASDAFFPFPDCVELAKNAGITAVVQPGGSIKDQDSVDYCNANDVAMVMTGIRHFKH